MDQGGPGRSQAMPDFTQNRADKNCSQRIRPAAKENGRNADPGLLLDCNISNCREVYLGRYRFIYQIDGSRVNILRLVTTDQNIDWILHGLQG